MFQNSHTVLHIFGIQIRIAVSWLLIAALITWTLAQHVFPTQIPGQTQAAYLLLSFVTMLLFFGSLLLHELAHAVVAKGFGIDVPSITLFLFGGVAELGQEPDTSTHEFLVAIAGPAMSFVLAFSFWLLSVISIFFSLGPAWLATLSYLALINLVLAIFNLLPAFPLDGGRILRAFLWARSGDILSATKTAGRMGEILAFCVIGLGLLGLFQGAQLGGAWQIMIGIFILLAAQSSVSAQKMKTFLGDQTAVDLMTRDAVSVSPDVTLSELVNQLMLPKRVSFIPVVENKELLGHIDAEILAGIDRENWSNTLVGDVFVKLGPAYIVSPQAPATDVLRRVSQSGRRKFLVSEGRHLLGVITLSDLSRYIGLLSELHETDHAP